jgi:hypothetical protein
MRGEKSIPLKLTYPVQLNYDRAILPIWPDHQLWFLANPYLIKWVASAGFRLQLRYDTRVLRPMWVRFVGLRGFKPTTKMGPFSYMWILLVHSPSENWLHSGVKYDNFFEMELKSTLCRVDFINLAPGLKSTLRGIDFNSAAGLFWRPPEIPTAELN